MRSATAPELAVLAGLTRTITKRVKVANGSGTMIDLSSWVESVEPDEDIDQPVSGMTIAFTRANGVLQTLAPLRTDSTLNVNDALAYSPQVDLARRITYELATTAYGVLPVAGDYKLLFDGTCHVVNSAGSPIVVTCRDKGALLVDRMVETPKLYGSGPGVAVQTVMQSIHDDVLGAGVVPVNTPVSPGYLISPAYQQQIESIMDADVALAQGPGWDVRYRWDNGTSTHRFTFKEPGRAKTVPDHTFGPSAYFDVTKLELAETDIRNVVIVSFRDSADLGNRKRITVSDGPSITKYGRKPLIIIEGDTSPIDTTAEATALGNAALADLKDPKADMEIIMPLFWPMELGDLYRFTANGVHFNTDQDLAVVSFTHGDHDTRLRVRGTPAGQYISWLGRGDTVGGPVNGTTGKAFAPQPFIVPRNTEANDLTWDLRFYAINGTGGGGTNLTYEIRSKKTFGTDTLLASGNASAFPRDLTITRDFKQDQVITFTVTDDATDMFASETYVVPAGVISISSTGNIIRSVPMDDGSYATRADDTTGLVIASGGRGKADFATRNTGGTTSFGVNRHNDEQGATNTQNKTFGVVFDAIPQMRALPQDWTLPGTSSTVDRRIEIKATGISVAGYTARAVYSTGSSASAKTHNPATTLNGTPVSSVTLTSHSGVAFWNLTDANGVLTTYYAHFDVDTTDMLPTNTLYVNLYRNDGVSSTTWTLVASTSYGDGLTLSDEQLSFAYAMVADWDLRVVITYDSAPPFGERASVVVKACTYDQITAGTEVALTGVGGNSILYQAMEAP